MRALEAYRLEVNNNVKVHMFTKFHQFWAITVGVRFYTGIQINKQ